MKDDEKEIKDEMKDKEKKMNEKVNNDEDEVCGTNGREYTRVNNLRVSMKHFFFKSHTINAKARS